MVDMFSHLHTLKKLQGKGNTAILLPEKALTFEQKLLFTADDEKGSLLHFPL